MSFITRPFTKSPKLATPTTPAAPKPARQAAPATTYSSTGLADGSIVQPHLDDEMGSGRPAVIQEVVPDLVSPFSRLLTYTKMMNDAGVDASIRVQKTPILGAEFYMEAYDDVPVNQEISDFVWSNLAGGMNAPFLNSLEDILHFFEDGYSVLEKVYELRSWTPPGQNRNTKQYTMLKKLGVRPPSTTKQIDYDDNGGPLMITQSAIRADGHVEDAPMDISKLLVFTFARKGGDLTGKSLLRTAYPHWYYKTHLYKIDAIQKERHSLGIPKGKLLPGYNKNDKTLLRTLLKNLRSNEESFMVLPPNVDVEFAEVHGQLVNVLESAAHHNAMIFLNVLAAFLAVSEQGQTGGSRSSGGTQSDLFMKTLKYIANYICDIINMYLIPELVVWNYPTTSFPKLKVRNIGETRDLQMLGSAIGNIFSQQGITPDLVTENWLRGVFDMPKKSQAEWDAAQAQAAQANTVQPLNNGGPSNGSPTGTNGTTQTKPNGTSPQKGGVKRSGGQPGKTPTAPQ